MSDERSANEIDRRLGQRVRARRIEIGMSQERLAELLGVTFQQVQKYEKGVNRIAASRLFDIATALDMPVGRFFAGLGPRTSPRSLEQDGAFEAALATTEGRQWMALFSAVRSPALRKRLVELAKAVAGESGDVRTRRRE